MSASKYTPGPWKYWNGKIYNTEDMNNGDVVVSVHKYGKEHDANARLIAAAPELFESLDRLVTQMTDEGGWEGYSLNEARAALAKARGAK